MRGISHKELLEIDPWKYDNQQDLLNHIIEQCKELNFWMTLEEFLKSGFEGECWLCDHNKNVVTAYHDKDAGFYESATSNVRVYASNIYRVQPIHKPEPPQDEHNDKMPLVW